MAYLVDGGGGGPVLDPKAKANERELFKLFSFTAFMVDWAADDWKASATAVAGLSKDVKEIRSRLIEGDGTTPGWTGPAAEAAGGSFALLSSSLDDRAKELTDAQAAMRQVTKAAEWAREQWYAKVASISTSLDPANFQKPIYPTSSTMTTDTAAMQAAEEQIYEQRDQAAKKILEGLNLRVAEATTAMPVDYVPPDAPWTAGGSGSGSGGSGSYPSSSTTPSGPGITLIGTQPPEPGTVVPPWPPEPPEPPTAWPPRPPEPPTSWPPEPPPSWPPEPTPPWPPIGPGEPEVISIDDGGGGLTGLPTGGGGSGGGAGTAYAVGTGGASGPGSGVVGLGGFVGGRGSAGAGSGRGGAGVRAFGTGQGAAGRAGSGARGSSVRGATGTGKYGTPLVGNQQGGKAGGARGAGARGASGRGAGGRGGGLPGSQQGAGRAGAKGARGGAGAAGGAGGRGGKGDRERDDLEYLTHEDEQTWFEGSDQAGPEVWD